MSSMPDVEEAPRSSRFPSIPPSVPPPPPAPTPEEPPPKRTVATSRDEGSREAFESQLTRDILAAERFRASLTAAIPTLALFALVGVKAASPEAIVSLLGNADVAPAGLFLIAVATFELFVLGWTRRLAKQGRMPPVLWRYGQAFVETSLPTAMVLYYAAIDGPAHALLMPPAFLYFVFILLSTLRLDFFLCAFTGLVAAGEYAVVALLWQGRDAALVSNAHHVTKAAILLVSGVAAGFVAQRLRRSFTRAIESVTERQRILGVFGQHVSPEVVDRLVAEKTTGESELRDVCVMFLDIRNFTAFTEKKSPAEVVDYLNTIFDATLDAVVSRRGIVNKFLGDGFMAVFGAPIPDANASGAAVDAALDIVARVDELVSEGTIPPTRIGIGLHSGKAVVGNIGSRERKEYTVIGDVVNVASRIEALNKELGSRVLASEETWSACDRSDIVAKQHDAIRVRGRDEPVRIWQLA